MSSLSTAPLAPTRAAGLSRAEWVTTGFAVVVSSTAYVVGGSPYLARGVVGDLAGFAVLAAGASVLRARLRHEALTCLLGIGVVVALGPDWPLRVRDAVWWAAVGVGLGAYVLVRRQVTD